MGISGRIATAFQSSAMTPLLALIALLLGLMAIAVTPKEEEPQIDVTFADVYIPFPGASPREVESLVTNPAEQIVSEINGIDKIYSFSQPGGAMIVAIFEVGSQEMKPWLRYTTSSIPTTTGCRQTWGLGSLLSNLVVLKMFRL
ncbi:acriflavin resistance protein [Vibrio variabilis]|uniref:Acriflavin resistance protein n=1 Tax=Vibrio variabilis TaxID=990271 RepID=A0ABQ0JQR1_9VIBR|nr:acriflavin resistance protein [Vibrio variabilis]